MVAKQSSRRLLTLMLALACLLSAPTLPGGKVDGQAFIHQCPPIQSFEGSLFALTVNNTLLNFNPGTPGIIQSARVITGLVAGESVVGIDFRPATGQLIGLTDAGRLYAILPGTGQATLIGTSATALSGAFFGFDFNPQVDRIRVVSNTGQNLRLNPNTGAVAGVDTNLAFAAGDANAGAKPNVSSSAYTNNFAGTTSTTLYSIDATLDVLVTQGSLGSAPVSPNSGQLFTRGALGVNTTELVGFDIAPVTNAAFASLTVGGISQLYTINLTTGAATLVGPIGGGQLIRGLAFATRAGGETILAITSDNTLVRFNAGVPGTPFGSCAITGLGSGETLVGIDVRPATGQLFALSDAGRIFTIDRNTCAATQVGAAAITPALSGASFGFDFNPTVDRIRLVSNTGQDLRLNPNTGAVAATDGTLAFAAGDANAGATPNVSASAYTNSFLGATSTTLFNIDTTLNVLVTQGQGAVSPNSGQLFTVGALGVDPDGNASFDISPNSGAAFATFVPAGSTTPQLYQVNLTTGAATLIGALGATGTIRGIAVDVNTPTGAAAAVGNVFAVTPSNRLVNFNAGTPGTIISARQINGLSSGETIVGLDFRPATGQLFAVSSASRIYTINTATGAATPVGAGAFTPALSGASFGFDFNPTVDRIRLVSNTGQDLRLNPNTGAVAATDGTLAFAASDANASATPNIVASAYTNSFLGATSTTLYNIDATLGVLVTQGQGAISPNSGQLFTVGSLGVTTTSQTAFDIAPGTNAAFASLTAAGATASQLYMVNLTTGAATLIAPIAAGEPIVALAIGSGSNTPASFDICLQDDRTGDFLQFDSCSGDYLFTRCGVGGTTLLGRGEVTRVGSTLNLRDARVSALIETQPFFSSRRISRALIRLGPLGPTFSITDFNMADNTCGCR